MYLTRRLKRQIVVLVVAFLAARFSGSAQVNRVEILTSGISCGVCAVVSEIQFRRMPGVGKVDISLSNESITISYGPDAEFSPEAIHQILQPLNVHVLRLRIWARGRIEELKKGEYRLVTGRHKFAVKLRAGTGSIQTGTPVLIEGIILNERVSPMELRAVKVSVLEKQLSK